MGFPYGLGLASFLDAYNQAEQRNLAGRSTELREALALHQLSESQRQRGEETSDIEQLSQLMAGRPAIAPAQGGVQVIPGGMPAVPGMEAEAALAGGLAGPPASTNLAPRPALTPILSGLDPRTAARLRLRPKTREAVESLEESERRQEQEIRRQEARQFFDVSRDRFKANDRIGGWQELAKAFDRMDDWKQAGHARDMALALHADKDEERKSGEELGRVLQALGRFEKEGLPDAHAAVLESLGAMTSKTNRPLRNLMVQSQLNAALGKNPFRTLLLKEMSRVAQEAWESTGKSLTPLEQVKAVAQRPAGAGLVARVTSELAHAGQLDKTLLQFHGFGADVDPAKLKDFVPQAIQLFNEAHRRDPQTRDEWTGVFTEANRLAGARKAAETQADPTKKELDQLRVERARWERDVREGKVEPNLNQLTLLRDRAHRIATSAETEQEDADAAKVEERYWSQRIADQIKKQPAGKEFGKPKAGTAKAIMGDRKFGVLSEEEKQGVLLAEGQRLFAAKVKTFKDLVKLSCQERNQIRGSIGEPKVDCGSQR